jgi:hypothetical protein
MLTNIDTHTNISPPTQVQATMAKATLLGLPVELRLRIYDFVFDGYSEHMSCAKREPPLLTANKQIRDESLAEFHSSCRWYAWSYDSDQTVKSLFRLGSERVAMIRYLEIRNKISSPEKGCKDRPEAIINGAMLLLYCLHGRRPTISNALHKEAVTVRF